MEIKTTGLFITGTDTDVGKTFIGSQIVKVLHNGGINVVPRKLIESGCELIDGELVPADANQYFHAVTNKIPLADICPYRFEPAISPQRAARMANQNILIANLIQKCFHNVDDNDFLVVEGAGGYYSPLCEDGLNSDLAKALQLPVVLIANDKLGCINHILLTIEAIQHSNLQVLCIVLNKKVSVDDTAMNNLEDLSMHLTIPIFSTTTNESLNTNSPLIEFILNTIHQ